MYLYNKALGIGCKDGLTLMSRFNNYGVFKDPATGLYPVYDIAQDIALSVAPNFNVAEEWAMEYLRENPPTIMADLEFCDLEYNDGILTNVTAFICEAIKSHGSVRILPKESQ